LLVLWATFTLSFVLLQVLPGDAVLIKCAVWAGILFYLRQINVEN
jgi:hypothetical protein